MRRLFFIAVVLVLSLGQLNAAKKYKFEFNPPYEVEEVMIAKHGTKFVKSWAIDKNADKAIIKAKQNAVAAMLFTGIAANEVMGTKGIPPICTHRQADYEANKEYFDKFMTQGDFLEYAIDINNAYPTGQNNIQTPNGRRVGVNLQLLYDELRNRLINDNIIPALGGQFSR